jgi:hypothetical protein
MSEPIRLGVILLSEVEGHAFFFGNMGMNPETAGAYLPDSSVRLAFNSELVPWSGYEDVYVAAVYCHEGVQKCERFAASFHHAQDVLRCETVAALCEASDAVILVNTESRAEENRQIVDPVIDAGIPIFVDKFLAADLADCVHLMHHARERGVLLCSSSLLRYAPDTISVLNNYFSTGVNAVTAYCSEFNDLAYVVHPITHLMLAVGLAPVATVGMEEDKTVRVRFENEVTGRLLRQDDWEFKLEIHSGPVLHSSTCPFDQYRPATDRMLRAFIDGVKRGANQPEPEEVLIDPMLIRAGVLQLEANGDREISRAEILASESESQS